MECEESATLESRVIRRRDMVPCRLAFIDCKMPGSQDKENYSLIGPGVTQSADQVVNITEPHGFSLGVAAMPPGTINNLHIHYTAEVFVVYSGSWTFRWGSSGEHEVEAGPGDVVSMPTWVFRGFTNNGPTDGWIFSALGGDDTGGIIWHPLVLETAARHGLYLGRDNRLIDTEAGAPVPSLDQRLAPIAASDLAELRRWTPQEMRERMLRAGERRFSSRALLDAALPGHGAELAPAIGHGMSEDRDQGASIGNPHGFSLDWVRLPEGGSLGPFRVAEKQVVIVFEGEARVALGEGVTQQETVLGPQEVLSPPPGAWRSFAAVSGPAMLAVLSAGDARTRIEWPQEIRRAACGAGLAHDHDGYIAPLRLLPDSRAA